MTTIFFHPSILLLCLDPGWVKIRIRDKHPGSATLTVCTIGEVKMLYSIGCRLSSCLNPFKLHGIVRTFRYKWYCV